AELGEVVRTAPEGFFCAIAGPVVTGCSGPDRGRSPAGRARRGGRAGAHAGRGGGGSGARGGAGEVRGRASRGETGAVSAPGAHGDVVWCRDGHVGGVVMRGRSCSRSRC